MSSDSIHAETTPKLEGEEHEQQNEQQWPSFNLIRSGLFIERPELDNHSRSVEQLSTAKDVKVLDEPALPKANGAQREGEPPGSRRSQNSPEQQGRNRLQAL